MLNLKIARDLLDWIDASRAADSRATFIIKTLRTAMNGGTIAPRDFTDIRESLTD